MPGTYNEFIDIFAFYALTNTTLNAIKTIIIFACSGVFSPTQEFALM